MKDLFSTIAATGIPPALHEPDQSSQRQVLLSFSADRMAQYKMIRQRGATRSVCGAQSERDARLRHVEGSDVPYAMYDRTRLVASHPAKDVHDQPWLKQRVEESHRGEMHRRLIGGDWPCE